MKLEAVVSGKSFEVEISREDGQFVVTIDGVTRHVDAHKLEADFYSILSEGRSFEVSVERSKDGYKVRRGGHEIPVAFTDPSRSGRASRFDSSGPEVICSAMPGRVVRILVGEGDEVTEGQGVIVVEAMKMENEIACGKDGKVASIAVKEGDSVEGGAELLTIE